MNHNSASSASSAPGRPETRTFVSRLRKLRGTIASRLIVVVVITGAISFWLIGLVTSVSLQQHLGHQAKALEELSRTQISERLGADAGLAKARLDTLQSALTNHMRQAARRPDVANAIRSRNEAAIRDRLNSVADISGVDRIVAFDASGLIAGASWPTDLVGLNFAISGTRLVAGLRGLIRDSSRASPRWFAYTHRLAPELLRLAGLPDRATLVHVAAEPVFDDAGHVDGVLLGFRSITMNESTLELFSSLSNSGVVLMQGDDVLSRAGTDPVTFRPEDLSSREIVQSREGGHLGRCLPYENAAFVCAFTVASTVDYARNAMFKIGEAHGRAQVRQFLTFAGLALLGMIVALTFSVRHIVRGLAPLSAAARAIAAGNLDTPFRANGVGEIHSLGRAFEKMLANLRDSTTRIRMLAFYDGVTQLPNREKMVQDAPREMARARRGALLFLDLDGFKAVNDSFGHKAGDVLLGKVGDRLSTLLADGRYGRDYLLSRLGGDEFAILLLNIEADEDASELAERIIQTLRAPFAINDNTANIGVSIGIALYPDTATTYDELLINADLAMYAAKSSGRNSYAFFTARLAADAQSRRALETDLIEAIRNEMLTVYFQPKVLCANGEIRGVEALARWFHPDRGPISPAVFIKLAEQAGLIRELGKVILRKSLVEMGRLRETGADVVLSVNVTATDIEDPKFPRDVVRLLQQAGFPADRLELEITESIAATNATAIGERMNALRQIGVRFSMDDFGAGYSNLATIARLPFDTIKIDRSLTHGVARDAERQTILRAAISLARDLGFETVVEGIEDAGDLRFAADTGATYVQGYIFSPPVPYDKLVAMLDPKAMLGHAPSPAQWRRLRGASAA